MRNSSTLRRLVAAALAIVMAMALAIPAFAVEIPNDRPDLEAIAALYANWDGTYELPDIRELSVEDQEILEAMINAAVMAKESESQTEAPAETETQDEVPVETEVRTEIQDEVPATVSFSDVPTSHTFYRGVVYCANRGIVNGYPDGTFRPATTVAKNHFAAMLARAFYPEQVEKYNTDYYKKNYGTFGPTNYALAANGILNNTSFRWAYTNSSTMGTGINRYDMAQMMTNVMKAKGFTASSSQKSAAQDKIADYKNIPNQYKDAVKNVYALGIITGYGDGSFKGDNIMNRGQAAIVIQRMAQYAPVKGDDDNNQYDDGTEQKPSTGSNTGSNTSSSGNTGNSGNTETTKPETKPETPKPTTVNVTSTKTNNGTAWMVPDNGYNTGYLNNGKPITEANVKAMLADAEKIWPDGMTWTVEGASGNNYYGNKGAIADGYTAWQIIHGAHRTDANYACGGFACMLSDYIFGPNASNPCRKLNDNTKVRPGDIVISTLNGTTTHVMIATSTVWYKSNRPGVFITNGNVSNQVDWTSTNGVPIDSYTNSAGTVAHIIYTRYPD